MTETEGKVKLDEFLLQFLSSSIFLIAFIWIAQGSLIHAYTLTATQYVSIDPIQYIKLEAQLLNYTER